MREIPEVTKESVERAKAAMYRERQELRDATGIHIDDDGRITIPARDIFARDNTERV